MLVKVDNKKRHRGPGIIYISDYINKYELELAAESMNAAFEF